MDVSKLRRNFSSNSVSGADDGTISLSLTGRLLPLEPQSMNPPIPSSPKLISRIYWPAGLDGEYLRAHGHSPNQAGGDTRSGYLVGWNYRSLVCCVVTVVPEELMSLSELERVLKNWDSDERYSSLWSLCRGPPIVLGRWVMSKAGEASSKLPPESSAVLIKKRHANLWLVVKQSHHEHNNYFLPYQLELYCCGYRYQTVSQIILYSRPSVDSTKYFSYTAFDCSSPVDPEEEDEDDPLPVAVAPLLHRSTSADDNEKVSDEEKSQGSRRALGHLRSVLRQLSFSRTVDVALWHLLSSLPPAPVPPSIPTSIPPPLSPPVSPYCTPMPSPLPSPSSSQFDTPPLSPSKARRRGIHSSSFSSPASSSCNSPVSSPSFASHSSCPATVSLPPHSLPASISARSAPLDLPSKPPNSPEPASPGSMVWRIVACWLVALRAMCVVRFFFNWPFKISSGCARLLGLPAESTGITIVRVAEHSMLVHQLCRRLACICSWPTLWRGMKCSVCRNDQAFNSRMVRFWSPVWQMIMDVCAGLLLSAALCYVPELSTWLDQAWRRTLHSNVLVDHVQWLMGLPAGMKLNEELNKRLGFMVLFGLDVHHEIVVHVLRVCSCLPSVLPMIQLLVSLLGVSVLLGFASDALYLSTLHLKLVHIAFTRMFWLMVYALSSLWQLFRGKKHNALRKRIDSESFSIDQLALGTILFTLISLLFPTVAMYYFFFSFIRLSILYTQVLLWFCSAVYNFGPFYQIGVACWDSQRFPGGVRIEVVIPSQQQVVSKSVGEAEKVDEDSVDEDWSDEDNNEEGGEGEVFCSNSHINNHGVGGDNIPSASPELGSWQPSCSISSPSSTSTFISTSCAPPRAEDKSRRMDTLPAPNHVPGKRPSQTQLSKTSFFELQMKGLGQGAWIKRYCEALRGTLAQYAPSLLLKCVLAGAALPARPTSFTIEDLASQNLAHDLGAPSPPPSPSTKGDGTLSAFLIAEIGELRALWRLLAGPS